MTFIYKTFRSFLFAANGILDSVSERNMKVHLMAAALVIFAGFYFQISQLEWILITIMISLVLCAEMFNTALEDLANIVRDELKLSYAATRRTRDLSAGAVFVLALAAAIVGLIIFMPKILAIL